MELSRAPRSRAKLAVDVPHMGATDNRHLQAELGCRLNSATQRVGVGGAVRHRGAVPVEDQRLKAPVQLGWKRCGSAHGAAAIVTFSSPCCSGSAKLVIRPSRLKSSVTLASPTRRASSLTRSSQSGNSGCMT